MLPGKPERPCGNSRISFVLTLIMLLVLPSAASYADGMVINANVDPYSGRWDYSDESSQTAMIFFDRGMEKMILSIGINPTTDSDMVWIFPVPAEPEKVALDILEDIPTISGEEVSGAAKKQLSEIMDFLASMQIYPIPFLAGAGGAPVPMANYPGLKGGVESYDMGGTPDVTVYEHIDKEGITSELVTARSAEALNEYLSGKGLDMQRGSIDVLDNYIGQDYSFVCSWISNSNIAYGGDGSTYPQYGTTEYGTTDSEIIDFLTRYFSQPYSYPELTRYIDELRQSYPAFDLSFPDPMMFLRSNEGSFILSLIVNRIRNNPELMGQHMYESYDEYNRDYEGYSRPRYESTPGQRGVFVTFPTRRIYFPLLPTSVYDSKVVPASIRVIGHVTPSLYGQIDNYVTTEYYINGSLHGGFDSTKFFKNDQGHLEYTKIDINAPSKFFTDDLWMTTSAPLKTQLGMLIALHPYIMGFILLVICSAIAGIVAGALTLRDMKHDIKTLALIGLSNCFTILGLIVTMAFLRPKSPPDETRDLLIAQKLKGYMRRRAAGTILLVYSIAFLFYGFIVIPRFHGHPVYDLTSVVIVFVLPIVALWWGVELLRARDGDKELLSELKEKGITPSFFVSFAWKKTGFVILFSAIYLVLAAFLNLVIGQSL